jgi:hypothetical protein
MHFKHNYNEQQSSSSSVSVETKLWTALTVLPLPAGTETISQDSSVGIVTGYRLDDQMTRVRFLAGAGNFSLQPHIHTGSGAHPTSYPMGTGALSLGVKWPGHEADHSPPTSAEVKNALSSTSTPQYAFMVWCSVEVWGQLNLLPLPLPLQGQIRDFFSSLSCPDQFRSPPSPLCSGHQG